MKDLHPQITQIPQIKTEQEIKNCRHTSLRKILSVLILINSFSFFFNLFNLRNLWMELLSSENARRWGHGVILMLDSQDVSAEDSHLVHRLVGARQPEVANLLVAAHKVYLPSPP
ncbi:MAG: hypothetical protein ACLQOO_36410 [Terriglobia bacterium]